MSETERQARRSFALSYLRWSSSVLWKNEQCVYVRGHNVLAPRKPNCDKWVIIYPLQGEDMTNKSHSKSVLCGAISSCQKPEWTGASELLNNQDVLILRQWGQKQKIWTRRTGSIHFGAFTKQRPVWSTQDEASPITFLIQPATARLSLSGVSPLLLPGFTGLPLHSLTAKVGRIGEFCFILWLLRVLSVMSVGVASASPSPSYYPFTP